MIKWFKEINMQDVLQCGGKGASLGEMTQAGIPVPDGFVITAAVFDEFAKRIIRKIERMIDEVDENDNNALNQCSKRIQKLIIDSEMRSSDSKSILNHFRRLDCMYVAVRSSATAEDSAEAAWAGQLDSFLNTDEKTLLKNVKRCWASLFTPRAIFYRKEKNINGHISVAVVVQKMIQSKVSGIAFSVHPVTKKRDEILIEACFGLGEAIVSGAISPDSYVVEKDGFLQDIKVSEQKKALVRSQNGNIWKNVSNDFVQKLDGKKILELASAIIDIEKHYGFPCDIEWAYDDKFYIVQSRPITTL
ncbi:hypothetical protein H6503_07025 [Candidatus Woesearchaeota archaeon]|nr:hypothetical protein [Candidatus Woesearchaeota archaeon]